jgi:toxin YoeB
MRVAFTQRGWEHYSCWLENDIKMAGRIKLLIDACRRAPFSGIGKPEPLRNEFKGWWSRRITDEHRLVYRVTASGEDQTLEVAMCRFHYRK